MDVEVGLRVVRGPDWKWDDQDGGEGNVGTVVEADSDYEATVCWDIGLCANYRCGMNDKYDLRVFDNAQIGVSHTLVTCDSCYQRPVTGLRWKCDICHNYDLCSHCYMTNEHPTEHRFLRYDTLDYNKWYPVPPRAGAKRAQAKGFFSGATVVRGKDWIWENQDGGAGNIGKLFLVQGWKNESYRSNGMVQWYKTMSQNTYRLGHGGKVDLKCKNVGIGDAYYVDHLPALGAASEPSSVFQAVQDDHQMMDLPLGQMAMLSLLTGEGLSPASFIKLTSGTCGDAPSGDTSTVEATSLIERLIGFHLFREGDVVRVLDDIAEVAKLQEDHGGWNDKIIFSLGQLGRVVRVFDSGDCRVQVNGYNWTLNPKCLTAAPGEAPPDAPEEDTSSDDSDAEVSPDGKPTVPLDAYELTRADSKEPSPVATPLVVPSPAASGVAAQTKNQEVTAEDVLDQFRDQFIKEMDADAVTLELLDGGIINGGDERSITKTDDPVQQNRRLHHILKQKCTVDAFRTVCVMIIAVKGNPKMNALGKSMKKRLETGDTVSSGGH